MRKASGFTLRRQKKTAAASTAREAFEEAPTTRSTLPSPEELNSQLQKRLTQELKGQLLDVEAKVPPRRVFFRFLLFSLFLSSSFFVLFRLRG